MAIGAFAVRVVAVASQHISPDGAAFVVLGRWYTFADPWRASFREPLWTAAYKATAPFGYSPTAAQLLTVVVSMVAVVYGYVVARRLVEPGWAAAVGVLLAFHPQLVVDAAGGSREPAGLLIAVLVVDVATRTRVPAWAAVAVGAAVGVRWELGVTALVVLAASTASRRASVRPLLIAVAAAFVVVGPFLAANRAYYGDPLYFSNVHASYWRNVEHGVHASAPEPVPADRNLERHLLSYSGTHETWGHYYGTLGGTTVAVRVAYGMVRLPVVLMGAPAERVMPGTGVAVGVVGVALAALGAVSRRRDLWPVALFTVGGFAAYAGLATLLGTDVRLVSFAVFPLAVLAAVGARRGRYVSFTSPIYDNNDVNRAAPG